MKRQVRVMTVLLPSASIAAVGLAMTAEKADAGGFIFRRGARGEISVGAWRNPTMVRPAYVTPYRGVILPAPSPPVFVYPSPPPVYLYPPPVHVYPSTTIGTFGY